MEKEPLESQVSKSSPVLSNPKSSGSLATVFKYISIGMGIIGIGFLIAIGGYLFAQK